MVKEEEALKYSTGTIQGSPLGLHPASIFSFSKIHISLVLEYYHVYGNLCNL